jgi:hypothetical protein
VNTTPLYAVRTAVEPAYGEGDDAQPLIGLRGEQLRTFGLPPLTQLVSHGNSYQVMATTAVAPVIAIPTTAYLLALYNNEPDCGKSYIIDSVFAVKRVAAAADQCPGILVNVSLQPIRTAIANTLIPRCLSGNRVGYGGCARVAVSSTIAPGDGGVASNWFPAGPSGHQITGAAANIGSSIEIDCKGRYIIPPKGQFSITVLSSVLTTVTYSCGLRWHEAILPGLV